MDDPDFNDFLAGLQSSDINSTINQKSMNEDLAVPAFSELPPPETPTASCHESAPNTNKKRFRNTTDEDLKRYEDMNQSDATKKNTKWGMKILQDWHHEFFGEEINMKTITAEDLAVKLGKFYCEARPKEPEKRATGMPKSQAEEYHKNSMKSIRAAINRHLSDIDRNIDIVNDREFKSSNKKLNGLLKDRMKSGVSRPTHHKDIIPLSDLSKISTYLENAYSSPITLRLAVWYNISIHFVSRGLEFHFQLNKNSFEFLQDDEGETYAKINHETQQKNYQGGLVKDEDMNDRRMYATGLPSCPVKMLQYFIHKTDANATSLFNQCCKDAITSPSNTSTWFNTKPLGKSTFRNFLPDICAQAHCSKKYTAHCLRATAIQAMSDAGHETRHIMYMSGHRNEASIRSYSRECSSKQKQSMSATLSSVASSSNNNGTGDHMATTPYLPTVRPNPRSTCTITRPVENALTQNSISSSVQSGMLTNSTFNNCTFNFNM